MIQVCLWNFILVLKNIFSFHYRCMNNIYYRIQNTMVPKCIDGWTNFAFDRILGWKLTRISTNTFCIPRAQRNFCPLILRLHWRFRHYDTDKPHTIFLNNRFYKTRNFPSKSLGIALHLIFTIIDDTNDIFIAVVVSCKQVKVYFYIKHINNFVVMKIHSAQT